MTTIAAYKAERLIGTRVGTATIVKELARGGMAIVFIAFQKTLKRQIAVKVLPKSLITARSAELFQQEAEAVAILSHPNIIPVYEVGETDEFLFITMQLIQGNTLAQYLQFAQKNPLPSRRVLPLSTTLPVMIQTLCPSVMGEGEAEFCFLKSLLPESICRCHRTEPSLRFMAIR